MSETSQQVKERRKQSIIAGALTGSAGVFLTKAIGLLYVIPFKQIALDNTVFYSYAYTIYDYALQIATSGLPFAVAALVAKYVAKNDYGAVGVVRKVSRTVMMLFGLISCTALILFSETFAHLVAPSADLQKTQTVIIIVAFALIFVPLLSYYRGIYQGFKEFKTYSFTQVLEQLIRVAFLLGASCICVYLLNLDRIWAAYMGVVSTSVSAIAAIIYFVFFDARYTRKLPASYKDHTKVTSKQIFRELMGYTIPYLISALITNSSSMIILLMLKTGLLRYGMDEPTIKLYQGIINFEAYKLISIPQVIATGFSLAIIPHITEAITNEDMQGVRKLFQKIIETVNYLAIPIIMFMIFFAREIYFIMYGNGNLDIGAEMLAKSLIVELFIIFSIVMDSTVIALKMRKIFIVASCCKLAFVASTLLFWLGHFGVDGYFICMSIQYLLSIGVLFYCVVVNIKPNLRQMINNCSQAWVACLPMLIIAAVLANVSFDITVNSRFIVLIYTGVMFVLTIGLYFFITAKFNLPQQLFGIEVSRDSMLKLFSRINPKK